MSDKHFIRADSVPAGRIELAAIASESMWRTHGEATVKALAQLIPDADRITLIQSAYRCGVSNTVIAQLTGELQFGEKLPGQKRRPT